MPRNLDFESILLCLREWFVVLDLAQKSNKLPWELIKEKQKNIFSTQAGRKSAIINLIKTQATLAPQKTEKNAKHNEVSFPSAVDVIIFSSLVCFYNQSGHLCCSFVKRFEIPFGLNFLWVIIVFTRRWRYEMEWLSKMNQVYEVSRNLFLTN